MVETLVNLVVENITSAAVKEILKLWRVGEQVEKVKRELDWIQAFLKDADRKQIVDETQKQWVREVREVGYMIEDVIDTFLCEVPERKPGKRGFIKNMFGKTKKLPVVRKLGDDLDQILARLQEIGDKKVKYGINSLGEDSGGGKVLPIRPPVLPDIEDSNVVGLDADRDNILKELLDRGVLRRSVVSIVGPGGLGKTTLAKKVYNSDGVTRKFGTRIWVTISQEFRLVDVLRKIIVKVKGHIGENEQGNDEGYLLTELYQSLRMTKCLLIIDDVWTKELMANIGRAQLMANIGRALPDDKNGSRILMTTRNFEVAKEADPACEPYKLDFLSEKSSLNLFLRKAFPNQEVQNECPSDLFDLTKLFVKKCAGLPLALIVLGGLLAKKKPTYPVWSKLLQTMNWHTNEQKVCIDIIGTSYDDLPLALKSCFMYFAMFPEDYNIDAPSLLKMWVAEGFIPQEENRTLEDTAESFLEDLVQRSMIQVQARTVHNDSILSCRIHDLLRDVAIQKAKEDNFLTVCSTLDEVQSCGRARRIAAHNIDCNELMKYANSNLRTLLCYLGEYRNCSQHRLLKVLSCTDNEEANLKKLRGIVSIKIP